MRKPLAFAFLAAGLALPALAQNPPEPKHDYTKEQRERAIARCQEARGSDCSSDAGLNEWLLQERSRGEAERDSSRSIHQTAPQPKPRSR